ncbi:unnamed protein product [Meloidogyne enterolobii]|uniref:Uncharacterized protein n=1 Tax=Meloidogyne enterolobii TaxID=390850 RepID=A0ACB0ZI53_MELEN
MKLKQQPQILSPTNIKKRKTIPPELLVDIFKTINTFPYEPSRGRSKDPDAFYIKILIKILKGLWIFYTKKLMTSSSIVYLSAGNAFRQCKKTRKNKKNYKMSSDNSPDNYLAGGNIRDEFSMIEEQANNILFNEEYSLNPDMKVFWSEKFLRVLNEKRSLKTVLKDFHEKEVNTLKCLNSRLKHHYTKLMAESKKEMGTLTTIDTSSSEKLVFEAATAQNISQVPVQDEVSLEEMANNILMKEELSINPNTKVYWVEKFLLVLTEKKTLNSQMAGILKEMSILKYENSLLKHHYTKLLNEKKKLGTSTSTDTPSSTDVLGSNLKAVLSAFVSPSAKSTISSPTTSTGSQEKTVTEKTASMKKISMVSKAFGSPSEILKFSTSPKSYTPQKTGTEKTASAKKHGICSVCELESDKIGNNYGAKNNCSACKDFFRNNQPFVDQPCKELTNNCTKDKLLLCKRCRYLKCLKVGMKAENVNLKHVRRPKEEAGSEGDESTKKPKMDS